MSNNKTTETAVKFTLHGYIKAQIAKAIGFHERTLPDMTWKNILQLSWLKIQIAISDLRTFLVGSKTDDELCGRRWFYLIDLVKAHEESEPKDVVRDKHGSWNDWFEELVNLSVLREMASFEMNYHRTGRPQYSWSRDDMSEEEIARLPDWWFDGTRAKRQLRKINAKKN